MTVQRAAGFRNGIDVRVRLRTGVPSADVTFDGAWWPRSRDLGAELPELIAALDTLGVRVERFTYPVEAWEHQVQRKVTVAGRTVRTGAFRSMDPQLVSLVVEGDRRIDLLVVPPEADALTGVRALRMAGLREDSSSPQRVLAAAGSRPRPEVVPITGVRAG
ncbi:DUF5994 family protein [Modestobacter versicolor]|uniref:Uncharacterized protein n=1 Tax=Modestobacter versicolor TaxID=429133 RepID=A0A323V8H9_9ACTN|nr:DUF5994 family protein [Modestobacter versicolor]MBB3676254.1 hypothetical protein [Modestobacter versicolor]PZA19626.1 hypothetical protein DMO24_19720 [Modestobacter versicolor]